MAGAEMKLPIWLAEQLTRKKVTFPTMPKTHAKAIRQELRVDAVSVSLAQNQYIYELGSVLATLTGDVELPPLLSSTFTARFAQLWDSARNWREEDTSKATSSMCSSEKRRTLRIHLTLELHIPRPSPFPLLPAPPPQSSSPSH